MKTKSFFLMAMATLMMAMPCSSLRAEETADSTQNKGVTIQMKGMTVNGKPATPQQKAVAKQMTKQGAKMAKKGVQIAMTAVTNPGKAEKLGEELEKMGDEMERLGDSLETLTEDTTFFYEGEDSDEVVLSQDDWDDLDEDLRDLKEELGLNTWWGKLIGGGLGLFGGFLGILFAIVICVLLFGLFTAPIWLVALIIWLIARSGRKDRNYQYQAYQTAQAQQAAQAQKTAQARSQQGTSGQQTANEQGTGNYQQGTGNQQGTQTYATGSTTMPGTGYVQPYPDENAEMWKSGIMYCCVGVGIAILFFSIGPSSFWGIGALVACIGVAKLVIATTSKGHSSNGGAPQQESFVTGLGDGQKNAEQGTTAQTPSTDDYNKSENA